MTMQLTVGVASALNSCWDHHRQLAVVFTAHQESAAPERRVLKMERGICTNTDLHRVAFMTLASVN